MDFFFSLYFPLVALMLLLVAFIYFGIVTIIRARKNGSDINITVTAKNKQSEIKEAIHELKHVESRLRSIAE